ncbi:MAG TPA: hypothetical protein VM243_05600 [Phycisphaerae bacterium]|nr:hypothetical protein [Phycisphaerae bacterium]
MPLASNRCLTALAVLLPWIGSCSVDTFQNQTASRGGEQAGSSGTIWVAFINNTPYRAIFTYGTYNNTSQLAQPTAAQFVSLPGSESLEGDVVANTRTLPCNRVFSVGDAELLRLIDENLDDTTLAPEALEEGIKFSSAPIDDVDANAATEGFAPPVRALLGVDFPCGAIIIIRFEIADVGDAPFRADFEIIPPAGDDRGI